MSGARSHSRRLQQAYRDKSTRKEDGAGRELKYRPNAIDRLKTAMQSGPVKTWADMTEDERRAVLASLKGR